MLAARSVEIWVRDDVAGHPSIGAVAGVLVVEAGQALALTFFEEFIATAAVVTHADGVAQPARAAARS